MLGEQPPGDAGAEIPQTHQDDLRAGLLLGTGIGGLLEGHPALEGAEPGGQALIQRSGIENHVGGNPDGHQAHQRDQAHGLPGDMTQADAQGPQQE